MYETMHRKLSASDRLLVASLRVLHHPFGVLDVPLPSWISETQAMALPEHQHSALGCERRGYAEVLVTMLHPIHELPAVTFPARANVHSAILWERLFPFWRRISHMDCPFENTMSRLHFVLITTWLRTFLGMSPGLDAGTKARSTGISS
jgi:hypothetical protein